MNHDNFIVSIKILSVTVVANDSILKSFVSAKTDIINIRFFGGTIIVY